MSYYTPGTSTPTQIVTIDGNIVNPTLMSVNSHYSGQRGVTYTFTQQLNETKIYNVSVNITQSTI